LLFEALVLLRERKVNVKLNLIGGGADRGFLQNMATKNNLNHMVTFSGIKIGEEKDRLIQKSDIFILTSRSEGLPTAVLEAASMALPLIITLPTNMGEYVENVSAGYVIPELTAESVSKAIQVAASQKKLGILEQKGKAAREMIKNSFTWLKIAKLMENNIYSKIDKNYRESD
jgi:glycosyltransferase involved in cell wall biosynthesis